MKKLVSGLLRMKVINRDCGIKYFLMILLMIPFYCGVIMLIGSLYPDFLGMNAFSYVYNALLNHFQLTDRNSWGFPAGSLIVVISYCAILFIQEIFSGDEHR
ncbi:hypothetical protein [Legionella sp. km772]|uniref:hypothetical protein n=1 Tax=Legionella sp. km772 TaxID=2498111 RepID=UPI000F8C8CD2|nr:hypothetical protein [Legionella sp. km772]RUR04906.1 hypothetical protein ELY15_14990 [Legionella sp. km772]